MKKELLCQPFDSALVKQREGAEGRTFSYVEVASIVSRLNLACEHWDFIIERYEILEEEVIVLCRLVIEGAVTKNSFGGSRITRDRNGAQLSLADDLKAAASDALKKAASLLGVGLEFYGSVSATPRRDSPPSQDEERLTPRQLSAIQSVARKQNLGDEQLARILESRFRKEAATQLTRREASVLLSALATPPGMTRH